MFDDMNASLNKYVRLESLCFKFEPIFDLSLTCFHEIQQRISPEFNDLFSSIVKFDPDSLQKLLLTRFGTFAIVFNFNQKIYLSTDSIQITNSAQIIKSLSSSSYQKYFKKAKAVTMNFSEDIQNPDSISQICDILNLIDPKAKMNFKYYSALDLS
jgi:hypothetical protein